MLNRIKNFVKHNYIVIFLIIGIIVALVVIINLISSLFGKDSPGKTDVVTLDGKSVSVFDEKSEAEVNSIVVDASVHEIKIKGGGKKELSTTIGSIPANLTEQENSKKFSVHTEGLGDGTTVLLQIKRGGDGTLTSERLSGDVERFYLAIRINNPNQQGDAPTAKAQTAKKLGIPNGTVYIGGTSFPTYGSEIEAQQAIAGKENQFTLPRYLVTNGLPITVVPNTEDTVRVWIQVTRVDANDAGSQPICPNEETDWAETLDVSQFAGHQVTLMLKAENGWAVAQGYSYISFFLPME